MNIMHWDPVRELAEMSERFHRIFPRNLPTRSTGNGHREALTVPDWTPAVDIVETDKDYVIKVELPEVKKEDVKVSIDNGILRVEGERKQETEEKNKKFHRVERFYGSFVRTFTVPENVDESKINAECKEGVLNISLPKTEKQKPKAIEVKVA